MMLEAAATYLIERALNILPRWLSRRLFPPHKLAAQVDIDLRRANPIDIRLGTEVPDIGLYFRIANLSPLSLVLDRLLVNLWVGQPTLRGAVLERQDVPKRSQVDVYFTTQLTGPQQEQIRKHVDGQLLSAPVTVYVKAYFESTVGVICVEKSLEQRDVPCK